MQIKKTTQKAYLVLSIIKEFEFIATGSDGLCIYHTKYEASKRKKLLQNGRVIECTIHYKTIDRI